eukprot:SAG31_NODE_45_length_31062_cov_17.179957_13_plen_149_part_00
MPLASDAKSSGSTSSKSGAAKGSPADVSPLPSAALVDAVSSQVVDRLGDLLDKKLAAALSGASASGAPPGTRAPPRPGPGGTAHSTGGCRAGRCCPPATSLAHSFRVLRAVWRRCAGFRAALDWRGAPSAPCVNIKFSTRLVRITAYH